MKILYLHQYFKTPAMSGGTRSYEMAKRMVAKGHEVHVITSRSDGLLSGSGWEQEVIEGIHVHWLPMQYHNSMGYFRRILAFIGFAARAGGYAARIGGDVVFATSTPLTIAIPGALASKRLGVPMVFEVRDLWPELPIAMGALNFPFAKFAAYRLERWAYSHSDRIVGLSPGMCEGVVATGTPSEKVVCIPNSADLDLFASASGKGMQFRSKRSWLKDRPLILYAGTLGRINGVCYLVEVAAAMLRLNPEVRFLVVGEGAEEELVRSEARNMGVYGRNFFMEPPVPKSEVPALLDAASIATSLFIPLRPMWNNSANKFFDALAAGKPLAINYGGWQSELLAKSGAGLSLPPNEPHLAAKAMHDFLSKPDRLNSASKASRELAEKAFSRDSLALQLISTLESAVRDTHD